MQSVHVVSQAEKDSCVSFINSYVATDELLTQHKYIPVQATDDSIAKAVKDGVLVAHILNKFGAGALHMDQVVYPANDKPLTIHQMQSNHAFTLKSLRTLNITTVNIGADDFLEGKVHLIVGLIKQIQLTSQSLNATAYVQNGRLVLIDVGQHKGKLAVITDIVDMRSIQVQGKEVPRMIMPISSIILTSEVCPSATPLDIKQAEAAIADLSRKYAGTTAGKKVSATKKRAGLNDFERFTARKLLAQRGELIKKALTK